ncbi:MAG: protein kinase [Rubripirellula sp.]
MTSEAANRNPVEVLGEEFLARWRDNEDPKVQDYVNSHPEHESQIRSLFPTMLAMEKLRVSKHEPAERPIRLHIDRLERLGDYRIIREIGHGGMGIVYEAEQQSLRRRVAVKIFPKQAIGDSQQLKRFQREAETIGSLHHTNIVPVFGVGEQDGLHYFVMQLLDGVPLDRVIAEIGTRPSDEEGMQDPIQEIVRSVSKEFTEEDCPVREETGTEGRSPTDVDSREFARSHWIRIADIGIKVADALQYAHAKGVLHRDIKPSNLILGNDFQVWVTDFGLAVAPNQDRLSRSGDVVGTLRYMSPEQLAGRSDRRSDVYGLGLTLYELLTLRPAFDGDSRGSLIRKVSTSTPPSPRSVCRRIPRDLETIILKAIAKSPESRYRTAAEFADDLRRFQNDQPIQARRIGPLERLARWSRRNPALAGMSAAMLIGAVFSLSAVSWNWRQAVHEKQNAELQGARAESNLTLALGSMDRLLERFESDWMAHPDSVSSGNAATSATRFVVSDQSAVILEEALQFYDQFAQQNDRSPTLQRETAKAYRRVGDILERLGRHAEALQAYQKSADTQLLALDSMPVADPELVLETSAVLNRLALVLHQMNRSLEAKQYLDQAKAILLIEVARNENSQDCIYELALTHSNLGLVLWQIHQGKESMQRHRRAILLLEGLAEEAPQKAKYRVALARAYRNYFPIASACKERAYAYEIRESAKEILEQLVSDFPDVPDYRCELSEMLAFTLHGCDVSVKGRDADHAVQLAEDLTEQFRAIPRDDSAVARALAIQGSLMRAADSETAFLAHEDAANILRGLCVRFPSVNAYRMLLAETLREQSQTLQSLGNEEEAICTLEEAVSQQSAFLEHQPDSMAGRKAMAALLNTLAVRMTEAGETHRAEELREASKLAWKRRPVAE